MFEVQESPAPAALTARRPADPPLTSHLYARIEKDFARRFQEEWGGRPITRGRTPGPDAIRLDSNDYLGLTGHPEILDAVVAALREDAHFSIQSGVFLLDAHPSRAVEKSLALSMGKDDGLLCQSGYAANLGLLQAIADEHTPVYIDSLAHMSLWQGAQMARAPARPFRHNDADHLDRLLARGGPGVVIVDSVYSTTGARCALGEIVEVTERHNSMIVVDESHSLGTHGSQGAGLCAELGLTDRVHFITASLAKAFAGRGGYFTVPKELRDYVLTQSFPSIFSSCLLPHEIAGFSATLQVIRAGEALRQRLWRYVHRLRSELRSIGYPIEGSEQILALEIGTESAAMVLRDALEAQGVFGAIFFPPATSRNRSMVRLTVSAALTDSEIDQVLEVAREIAPQVKPWTWPAARRAAVRSAAAA
ncbi:MAG: alpha-hydroxyketone-type quorum-sensing autoinducer synthase [Betaproteobacteria bacterium]